MQLPCDKLGRMANDRKRERCSRKGTRIGGIHTKVLRLYNFVTPVPLRSPKSACFASRWMTASKYQVLSAFMTGWHGFRPHQVETLVLVQLEKIIVVELDQYLDGLPSENTRCFSFYAGRVKILEPYSVQVPFPLRSAKLSNVLICQYLDG